jgi:hypothetical protein
MSGQPNSTAPPFRHFAKGDARAVDVEVIG